MTNPIIATEVAQLAGKIAQDLEEHALAYRFIEHALRHFEPDPDIAYSMWCLLNRASDGIDP